MDGMNKGLQQDMPFSPGVEGLRTQQLAIGYDSDIVRDIALSVVPGKVTTLIGPNGCGKSTLLKTVTGELRARGGLVMIDGKERSEYALNEIAKKVSIVMTGRVAPELMTCREVIESGRYPYTGMLGKLSDRDRQIVASAMEMCECTDIADRPVTRISDGQRQRVMLCRAIAQDPEILVLDEPTSYLDIRYKIDILTKIRSLADKGVAVLMSLHEPEIAMRVSDTVIAMGEGKILGMGSPKEVFTEEFIRRLYKLGDMDTSIIGGTPWL